MILILQFKKLMIILDILLLLFLLMLFQEVWLRLNKLRDILLCESPSTFSNCHHLISRTWLSVHPSLASLTDVVIGFMVSCLSNSKIQWQYEREGECARANNIHLRHDWANAALYSSVPYFLAQSAVLRLSSSTHQMAKRDCSYTWA